MELELRALRKVYSGGKVGLDGIDVTFVPGVTGLVGPNGSGKHAAAQLATTLAPTSGTIAWNGADAARMPMPCAAICSTFHRTSWAIPTSAHKSFSSISRTSAASGGAPRGWQR